MKAYEETVDFLFAQLPVFQRDGAEAYKPGLDNIHRLCSAIGNPQTRFRSVHIGGTNGKGSTSHSLAAILQQSGYKTGLYTSPHLVDFRERIRIDGKKIEKQEVVDTIDHWLPLIDEIKPSFFELTVALAFYYFAKNGVEVAVIEVGMGGRLDSTNVITPILSVITNISLDHQKFLGNTIAEIALEKAGIVKGGVPLVVSERQSESAPVFTQVCKEKSSKLIFATDAYSVENLGIVVGGRQVQVSKNGIPAMVLTLSLLGLYQLKNLPGILAAVDELNKIGLAISTRAVVNGLANVQRQTGLMGRWQIIANHPMMICDTGHNQAGIEEVVEQLNTYTFDNLWIIWGMVSDKDHAKMIGLLPLTANVVVTQPSNLPRAMPKEELATLFLAAGFQAVTKNTVPEAIDYALQQAGPGDLIFIGGSTFTVADIPFEKFLASA